jgi:hypothetical protein
MLRLGFPNPISAGPRAAFTVKGPRKNNLDIGRERHWAGGQARRGRIPPVGL